MAETLGSLVRELRTARRMTLRGLAAASGVSPAAVSKWETGRAKPRMPELDAVLDALGCPDTLRHDAYAYVDAPRAVARLRETVQPVGGEGPPALEGAWFPSSGDLLRSLRLRRGLSLEQAAAVLAVHPSTVSRWEASKAVPSAACRDAYCSLLCAEPEECRALQGLFLTFPQAPDSPARRDVLEYRLDQLQRDANGGQGRLMELRFLSLAAQLSQQAPHCRASRRLLAITHAWHAQWLLWNERLPEAGHTARRTLDVVESWDRPEPYWFRAVYVYAACLASSQKRPGLIRGARFVQDWLPAATRPETEAWMRHTIASYALRAGYIEDAMTMAGRADDAIARSERSTAIRLASTDSANLHVRMGRFEEARALLSEDDRPGVHVHHRAYQAIIWTETLLGLGDRSGAYAWYERARALERAHGLSPARYTASFAARF